jgi:hypothetical protein
MSARPSAGTGFSVRPSSTTRTCATSGFSFRRALGCSSSAAAPASCSPRSSRRRDVENADFIRSLPGPFDAIVVVDILGALDDCQAMSENLHALCTRETRLVVGYCSHLWYPALKSAEVVGGKRRAERTARIAGRGAITRMSTTLRVTE